MKKIWQFILVGIVIAYGGMWFSDLAGDFSTVWTMALRRFWASVCICVLSL